MKENLVMCNYTEKENSKWNCYIQSTLGNAENKHDMIL